MAEPADDPRPAALPITPRIRLSCETLQVERGDGLFREYKDVDAAVIELGFDYDGVYVRSTDPTSRVFRSTPAGTAVIERDRARERQAQYVLESFGALDLSCMDEYEAASGSRADYLVHMDGDVHALCSFSAYVVPQLRELGWRVDMADDYPYRVVAGDAPWYAEVGADERADWFNLELGVEVGGERINMLPLLVDLIERTSELDALAGLGQGRRRCVALPVSPGQYLAVPPERVQTLVRVLLELYRGERDALTIRFPGAAAAALGHLEHELGDDLVWHDELGMHARGRSLARAAATPVEETPPPRGLCATLRPYQEQGLSWLQTLRAHEIGGVLADDMGLGKTLQTIAHLLVEKESGRMDAPCLVVAPTSLVTNWQRELSRFGPDLSVLVMRGSERHTRWHRVPHSDVVITTYPLLARDRERFATYQFHYVILDEAQVIKNAGSQARSAAVAMNARHRLCLSGTPVENHLGELWSLFDFLAPGLLGTREQFRTLFRTPIERQGDDTRLLALKERVAPYILRRLKEDVAPELPKKTELTRPVELRGAQRDLYESIRMAAHAQVRQAIRERGFASSAIDVLDALLKLRQVCCDPRLIDVPSARQVEDSAKYQLLFELLATQLEQQRRVLLFSQFTSMLALIAHGLEQRGIRYAQLTGSTADRQKPIDRFDRGQADVFLISLKAGGTGLNLTRADTVIHYDPWWNPQAQAQATDRAYRIGQKRPVFVYNLIVAGSVEERMMALKRRKQKLADTLLGQSTAPLSESEIEDLFAPLDG